MLLAKPLTVDDIVTFRLTTGEEIVGRFVAMTEATLDIKAPVALRMLVNQQTGEVIPQSFLPPLFSAPEKTQLRFNMSAVAIRPVKVQEEMATAYMKATTSLELPGGALPGLIRS